MLLLAVAIAVIILSKKPDGRGRQVYEPVVRSQPIAPVLRPRPETFRRPAPPTRPARPVTQQPKSFSLTPDPRVGSTDATMPEAGGPDPTVTPAPPVAATDLPPLPAGESPAKTETLTEPTFSQPSTSLPPVSLPAGMPEAKSAPDAALALPVFPAGPTLGPPDAVRPLPPSPEPKPAMSDTTPEPPKPTELAVPPKPTEPTSWQST